MYLQTESAKKAFQIMDVDEKKFVVLEDLRRVAAEVLLEEQVSDDELHEMIQEFDRSGSEILSEDDFVRIARKVGL